MNVISIQALHLPSNNSTESFFDDKTDIFVESSTSAMVLADKIDMMMKVTPSWSAETAYGKMDAIPFYSNTTRAISYNFLCKSKNNMKYDAGRMTRNVDKLLKFQYPRYSGPDGFQVLSAPPLFRVSFTKIDTAKENKKYTLYEQVEGYINGDIEVTPGHAGPAGAPTPPVPLTENGTESSILGMTSVGISFTITVLHRITPGWTDSQWTGPGFYSAGNTTVGKGKLAATDPDATINANRNKTKIA